MSILTREPPASDEVERGALGAMLLDPLKLIPAAQARYGLSEDSFHVPANRVVMGAIRTLFEGGRPVDSLTVTDLLTQRGDLEKIGGMVAVANLIDACPTAEHGEWYFNLVRSKHQLRRVVDTAHWIEQSALEAEANGDAIIAQATEKMARLAVCLTEDETNADVMARSLQGWTDAADGKGAAIGMTLPWETLTRCMCGLEPGVTIVAGRPSAGKTTLEDQIAVHCARKYGPVLRVTLDSTRKQLLERAMCRGGGVSLPKLKFGFGRKSQIAACAAEADALAQLPMVIDDRSTDISAICAAARAMKAKQGLVLLTVDYIQLVQASEMGRSGWDEVARVTYVSTKFKALAYELGIPALVLSQLSRAGETEGRPPQLTDLRSSGAIEQDANKVILLSVDAKTRKAMEEEEPGATKHKRPLIIDVAKHKDGETGRLGFWMYPPYFRFEPAQGMFDDRDLPSDRHDDGRAMDSLPEYAPKPEGVKHGGTRNAERGTRNGEAGGRGRSLAEKVLEERMGNGAVEEQSGLDMDIPGDEEA